MVEYKRIISSLGIDKNINAIASGEISLPMFDSEAPAYWYGFPPALIPIWSNSNRPKYFGIWKHWFLDRQPTYVEMLVAADRLTLEIARTSEQLFCFVIISSIVEEDNVTAEIKKFSDIIGIKDLDEINAFTLTNGDNSKYFSNLSSFSINTPLRSINNNFTYNGEFPFLSSNGSILNFEKSSEFEINEELSEIIKKNNINVPWLGHGNSHQDRFDKCLFENKLGEAWLTLNCRGWSIEDARKAISKLAKLAGDPEFNDLASAWLSVADPKVGGY